MNTTSSITATSPGRAAGTVDVTVTTGDGTSATSSADKFTYAALPTVTAVSPVSSRMAGGSVVTITGTGFLNAGAVAFGSTAASTYTIVSSTEITATAPTEPAGTVDITVTTPVGTSATSSADHFTYESAPTVGAVAPPVGPLVGGTSVTVTGTGYIGVSAVSFGSVAAASYTVNSVTSLTAVSPAEAAGIVDLTVTTPVGTSQTGPADKYTYVPPPTVTAVSPVAGLPTGGTSVTITGTGFNGASPISVVDFGTTAVTSSNFTINSATSITITSPAELASTVDVTVTNAGGTSATSTADHFTYETAPTVSAVSPVAGLPAGGTSVTITGTNFIGVSVVKFGARPATSYVFNSATQVTATSPAESAGTVDVTITTPVATSTTSAADQFTYEAAPTVTAIEPDRRPVGGRHSRHDHRHELHGCQCGRFRQRGCHYVLGRLRHLDNRHLPGRVRGQRRRDRHHADHGERH